MEGYVISVGIDEYNLINRDLTALREKIKDYPKGSLRKRIIKGREYYYLQYREGRQVKSQYVKNDELSDLKFLIEERKSVEEQIISLQKRAENYSRILGVHRSYRPVKNVDYKEYTLFISDVAHDYKSMDIEEFLEKYRVSKYRGIKKRYIAGFFDYINGIERGVIRRTNDLVLDPNTYLKYFIYGEKTVLNEELEKAIPAFLCRGLLITNVEEGGFVTP